VLAALSAVSVTTTPATSAPMLSAKSTTVAVSETAAVSAVVTARRLSAARTRTATAWLRPVAVSTTTTS